MAQSTLDPNDRDDGAAAQARQHEVNGGGGEKGEGEETGRKLRRRRPLWWYVVVRGLLAFTLPMVVVTTAMNVAFDYSDGTLNSHTIRRRAVISLITFGVAGTLISAFAYRQQRQPPLVRDS